MRRASSQPLLKQIQETTDDEEEQEQLIRIKRKSFRDVESVTTHASCITITKHQHKLTPSKDKESSLLSWGKYSVWKQEHKVGTSKLKKQLKSRWAMQKLIDQQLCRLQAHYGRAAIDPIKMSDVAQLLRPKWAQPLELAAVSSWFGDWRPSTVLQFLLSSVRFLSDPNGVERTLTQLIHDVRVEEAVIDEEMTEIQATCVLNLPFGPNKEGGGLGSIVPEFKKIHSVIVKAQNLRMKTLQVVVKKVLSQGDAAEFLVDFAGIQDAIRCFAVKNKRRQQGPVCAKELGRKSG